MVRRKCGNDEGSIYYSKDVCWVRQYLVHTAKGPKYHCLYGKTWLAMAEKLTGVGHARHAGIKEQGA